MKTQDEARAAWIEALRSGEYEQAREYLSIGGKYCCLGVACELAIKDGVPVKRETFEAGTVMYGYETGEVPEPVREWLGLDSSDGSYRARNNRHTSLAARNDARVPFEKIAAIIESAPTGLFRSDVDA